MNVKLIYEALLGTGKSKKDAAKEAQARTGLSAVSGKPIDRSLKFKKTRSNAHGQYTPLASQ